MAFHSQDISNGSRGHYLSRAPGLYTVYFPFVRAVCALEEKLADFARAQKQLMEVTVCLTVSDEPAGC